MNQNIKYEKNKIVLAITDSVSATLIEGQCNFLMNNGYKVAVFSSKGSEILKLQKKEKFILFEIYFV